MNRAYWQASHAPRYALLFALPLLLLYQVLAAAVPAGPEGGVRNGADVMLQAVFIWLAGSWGPRLFMTCLIIAGLWLVARDLRSNPGRLRATVFATMVAESIGLALVFGIVVGGLTAALLGEPPALSLVLQGTAQLDSDDVGVRVDAKVTYGEDALRPLGHRMVGRGSHDEGGLPLINLLRERRPRQHGDRRSLG